MRDHSSRLILYEKPAPLPGSSCMRQDWSGLSLYPVGYNESMRPVRFLGDSLKCLRDFPDDARHDAGYQLDKVQRGGQPDDFKPMPAIGKGMEEIRVSDPSRSEERHVGTERT